MVSRQSDMKEVKARVHSNVHDCGMPPAQARSAQQVRDTRSERSASRFSGQELARYHDW